VNEARDGAPRLRLDPEPFADAEDFVDDRHRDGERLRGRHFLEVSGDVFGGRLAAGLREPALAEADEDPREAAGAGRVV